MSLSSASGTLEPLAALFQEKGGDVNPKLKSLIGQVVGARLPSWREAASLNRVSLPRLVDHDWVLHQQRASSQVASMSVPSVVVRMRVEAQPEAVGTQGPVQNVDFELSREALETMLDGLNKIRDQLGAMGSR